MLRDPTAYFDKNVTTESERSDIAMSSMYYFVLLLFLFIVDQSHGNDFNQSSTFKGISRQKRATYQRLSCANKIKSNGMSLINEGISMIDPTIKISGRFYGALKELYDSSRTNILSVTIKELGKYSEYALNFFNGKSVFEEKYIYLYTTDALYDDLNKRLRDHDCTYKALGQTDKHLAPFAAVLWSVLYYWPTLKKEKGMTYRGVNMVQSDINKYKKGYSFVWNQFVSTARKSPFDKSVIFNINNKKGSTLSPSLVKKYAWKKDLDEALYCPGAQFRVLKNTYDKIRRKHVIDIDHISNSPTSSAEKLLFSFVVTQMTSIFVFILKMI